jgi:hypothetical protein
VFVTASHGRACASLHVVEQCLEIFSAPEWREVLVVIEFVDIIESKLDGLSEGRQGGSRPSGVARAELGFECERAYQLKQV